MTWLFVFLAGDDSVEGWSRRAVSVITKRVRIAQLHPAAVLE